MAKGGKTVSQSRTMWVPAKKDASGKVIEKGYLAQKGKPEKRVTAKVKIVADTESGKKAGETYQYKAGRTVGKAGAKQKQERSQGSTRTAPAATPAPKAKRGASAAESMRMKANQPKSGGMAPASSARAGMARTRAEAPGRRARTGGPSGGGSKAGVYVPAINQTVPRQGYTAKTNPQNKGRVTGGPQSRKDVPKAALTALAMYPVAAGAAGVARIASAGRSAAAGARQGISSLGARPAAQAAPSAAKAAAPKAAAKPTTMRQIGGTKKGVRPETGSVRAPGSKTPMRPAKPTPGQKGTLTKYAKKKAEAASKGKRGKKK